MAKRVISTLSENVYLAPGLRPLMTEIAQETVRDLEKMPGASQAGITEPATRLAFHQLMYDLQREMGKTEEAWTHVTAAHKIARQRIVDQRGSQDSKQNLAVICLDMAKIRQEYDRDMDASLANATEGIQLCEEILRQPMVTAEKQISLRLLLSHLYSFVGATHVRLGVPAKALEYFEKSRTADEQTLKDPAFEQLPENSRKVTEARIRAGSATSLLAIGDMHFRLGNPDMAKENYKQALALREEIFQGSPNLSQSKYYVAAYCSQSGYLHFVLGEVEVARPLYERAVKLATELAAVNRNSVEYFRTLALAHYRFGVFKKSLNDPTAAEHFETCLKIRTSLAKDAANVSRQRELLLALARAGKHAEAAALAEQLLAQVKSPDVELLLDLARAYTQCSVAAADDQAAAEALRAKAIATLKQAVDQGHRDRVYLETEPDFVPLRELPEFQALVDREREAAKDDR
jgi:tetratricopeptide (TPR) repeat protein